MKNLPAVLINRSFIFLRRGGLNHLEGKCILDDLDVGRLRLEVHPLDRVFLRIKLRSKEIIIQVR